jgi:hypothetical protein
MLARVRGHILRYIVMSKAQATICAVWVLHTWTIQAASKSPYLLIEAAERACGKSTLLDLLDNLSFDSLSAGCTTGAALVRALNERPRTLFLDEIDLLFAGDSDTAAAVAGVLNCDYQRGKKFLKCDGKLNEVKEFDAFGAKALSGISGNKLPESTISRCVRIEMRRKRKDERVARFVERDYAPRSEKIRAQLKAWSATATATLGTIEPELIPDLSDRQNDAVEPLLAIAELAGDTWPGEIRAALVELFAEAAAGESSSAGERLLLDCQSVFDSSNTERINTHDLITALCQMEENPWATWNRGQQFSPRQLAERLRRFGIAPQLARYGGHVSRGYCRKDFEEAWERYLPSVKTAP